jgi:hypothetical protein
VDRAGGIVLSPQWDSPRRSAGSGNGTGGLGPALGACACGSGTGVVPRTNRHVRWEGGTRRKNELGGELA